MPNLGDRLRALELTRNAEEATRAAAAARGVEAEEQKRVAAILDFFEQTKRVISANIIAGRIPGEFTVPPQLSPAKGAEGILNPSHKDHYLYATFLEWARAEGMDVSGHHDDTKAKFMVVALPPDA